MDLEEKIRLGVILNIDKDVTEIVDETLEALMESNIKLIRKSFNEHSNMTNKIAAAKVEEFLVDVQIVAKRERVKAFDKWKANQEEIRGVDIETKEAYLHKRISEKASEALAKEKEKSPNPYNHNKLDDNYIELLDS